MSIDFVSELNKSFEKIEQLSQLNYELLEQLNVIFAFINTNKIEVPNPEKLASLLSKAMAILAEIQADEPKMLRYKTLSRRKVTDFRTDEDETEPQRSIDGFLY